MPLFSPLGCNAGTCHGAVQGQNGFRLTLFGADPSLDHQRLLRDHLGRRLDLVDPDNSLLLLKASGRVLHEGGVRTALGIADYAILRDWITRGAKLDDLAQSQVKSLIVTPEKHAAKAGESYALRVEARFADGTTEDVTGLCTFESTDKGAAEVDVTGLEQTGTGTFISLKKKNQSYQAPSTGCGTPEKRPDSFVFPLDCVSRL